MINIKPTVQFYFSPTSFDVRVYSGNISEFIINYINKLLKLYSANIRFGEVNDMTQAAEYIVNFLSNNHEIEYNPFSRKYEVSKFLYGSDVKDYYLHFLKK